MSTFGAFDAYVVDEQEKQERMEAQEALTKKLNAYCDEHGLPHDSADELALRDDITGEQRAWLIDFIDEWDAVADNVLARPVVVQVGYRFRLKRIVDRWPDFLAPAGLTGTVTVVEDEGIWGKMDQHIPGAEQWDNQIHWYSPLYPEDFPEDTEAL